MGLFVGLKWRISSKPMCKCRSRNTATTHEGSMELQIKSQYKSSVTILDIYEPSRSSKQV